ncbi:MAG: glycosyl hydrolase family 18 protein, partial [Bacteroidota bacterium]
MIKMYILKTIFVLSLSMFFHFSLFSQVAVVGFADGGAYIGKPEFPEHTTTTFPSNLQLEKLTHVIAADIGCRNNGSLFTGKLPDFWQGTPPPDNVWNDSKNEWLENLVNRAHAKGVNASISVGGDYFIDATGSTYINAFVGNIVNFVDVHGFDGVNINWEYPSDTTEWNQCIALLDLLKDNLPSTKRLTIALSHATHVYDSFAFVPPQILSIVDGIYLMTYDEGDDAWASHSDVEKSIDAINEWISWQTPTCTQKKKLFLGSAFYGWHTAGNDSIRIPYRDYILNNDTRWNSNPGDLTLDARNKAIHTRDNGFGGVFIWE